MKIEKDKLGNERIIAENMKELKEKIEKEEEAKKHFGDKR